MNSKRNISFLMFVLLCFSGICSCAPEIPEAILNKPVPDLIRDLKSEDGVLRAQAVIALGMKKEAAKEAVPDMILLLADSKPYVRNRAMGALANIGPLAIDPLILATHHKERTMRFYAAHALKKIPDQKAQDAYAAYMEHEGSKIVKSS